jgi:hypothetical protein
MPPCCSRARTDSPFVPPELLLLGIWDVICVATTLGNREIALGGILVALVLLYVIFDLECALLLGCYFSFLPAFLVGFDGIFLSLIVLLFGVMLLAAGAVRRARARLPAHIV